QGVGMVKDTVEGRVRGGVGDGIQRHAFTTGRQARGEEGAIAATLAVDERAAPLLARDMAFLLEDIERPTQRPAADAKLKRQRPLRRHPGIVVLPGDQAPQLVECRVHALHARSQESLTYRAVTGLGLRPMIGPW